MSEQERVNAEASDQADDREIERLLGAMVPVRTGLDAGKVLAEAIRRSDSHARAAGRQAWIWRGIAGGLAASLAVMAWIHRATPPAERIVERIVRVPMPAESATITAMVNSPTVETPSHVPQGSFGSCAYLTLRQEVLTGSMDTRHDSPVPADMTPPPAEVSPFRMLRADGGGM